MTKLEVRVPHELEDLLGLVAAKLATRLEALCAPLLRFYLGEVARDAEMATLARVLANDRMANGRNAGRISLSLAKPLWEGAWARAKQIGFTEKSEVVRGVIVAAAIDAGVDSPRPGAKPSARRRQALEAIAASL